MTATQTCPHGKIYYLLRLKLTCAHQSAEADTYSGTSTLLYLYPQVPLHTDCRSTPESSPNGTLCHSKSFLNQQTIPSSDIWWCSLIHILALKWIQCVYIGNTKNIKIYTFLNLSLESGLTSLWKHYNLLQFIKKSYISYEIKFKNLAQLNDKLSII